MVAIEIILPSTFTQSDSDILAQYLREGHRLSWQDWQALARVMDKLKHGQVWFQDRQHTFHRFYEQMVDRPYAGPFLDQLYDLTDVAPAGQGLWATYAKEVTQWLRQTGFQDVQTDYAGYLVAYCLYWWSAFARGHIFELFIFRDLEASGVDFSPHDPRLLSERYARHDLVIGEWRGDVKLSFYFLGETEAPPLDFYITRVYDRLQHIYQIVVLTKMSVWRQIDGDTLPGQLATALSHLPHPIRLHLGHLIWVLSTFKNWKRQIRIWQGA